MALTVDSTVSVVVVTIVSTEPVMVLTVVSTKEAVVLAIMSPGRDVVLTTASVRCSRSLLCPLHARFCDIPEILSCASGYC